MSELLANSPTVGIDTPIATLAAPIATLIQTAITTSGPAESTLQGGQFRALVGTLNPNGTLTNAELVLVTAGQNGTAWTITRGPNLASPDTNTAQLHQAGDSIWHVFSAGGLEAVMAAYAAAAQAASDPAGSAAAVAAAVAGEIGAANGIASLDSGQHLTPSQVPPSVVNASDAVGISTLAQGCVCDATTFQDGAMTKGTNVLNNPSGAYSALTDIGKLVVVNGAGAQQASTTNASYSGTVTTIALAAALTAATPAGSWTISNGVNSQVIPVAAAANGATSLSVLGSVSLSSTYAVGSTITQFAQPLSTTITGVNSATQVITAANAGTTVTGAAEVVYGTNNLTTLQAAINAAIAAKSYLYVAPGPGEGYMYYGGLTVAGQCDIRGAGCRENFGSMNPATQAYASVYVPTVAPYLTGSVLIQAAPSTNILDVTQTAFAGDIDKLGGRFAGKYNLTGHGLNTFPGALGTGLDNGWYGNGRGLKFFGIDGNHYGVVRANAQYSSLYDLRTYGGGHILEISESQYNPYGNVKRYNGAGWCGCAGTAFGIFHQTVGGENLNLIVDTGTLITMSGPNTSSFTHPAGTGGCASTQPPYSCSAAASNGLVFINPVYQATNGGQGGSAGTFSRTSSGNYVIASSLTGNAFNGTNLLNTIVQNASGSELLINQTLDFCPTPGASATANLEESPFSNMATPGSCDAKSFPAGSAPNAGSLSSPLSTGSPITSIPTNALTLPISVPPQPNGNTTTVAVTLYDTASGQQQTFQTTGAAIGATSIPITSATPTFAFPTATTQILLSFRHTLTGGIGNGEYAEVVAAHCVFVAGFSKGYASS